MRSDRLLKLTSEAIRQLQDETGLSLIRLWLAGLLGGLKLRQTGGFYEAVGVFLGVGD